MRLKVNKNSEILEKMFDYIYLILGTDHLTSRGGLWFFSKKIF